MLDKFFKILDAAGRLLEILLYLGAAALGAFIAWFILGEMEYGMVLRVAGAFGAALISGLIGWFVIRIIAIMSY